MQCEPVSGLGFRRGSYRCLCKIGYYFPDVEADADSKYFNGTTLEEEYAKILEVRLTDTTCSFTQLVCAAIGTVNLGPTLWGEGGAGGGRKLTKSRFFTAHLSLLHISLFKLP